MKGIVDYFTSEDFSNGKIQDRCDDTDSITLTGPIDAVTGITGTTSIGAASEFTVYIEFQPKIDTEFDEMYGTNILELFGYDGEYYGIRIKWFVNSYNEHWIDLVVNNGDEHSIGVNLTKGTEYYDPIRILLAKDADGKYRLRCNGTPMGVGSVDKEMYFDTIKKDNELESKIHTIAIWNRALTNKELNTITDNGFKYDK